MDKIILKEGDVIDLSKLKNEISCITQLPAKFQEDTISDKLIWKTITFNKLYKFNFNNDFIIKLKKDLQRILNNKDIKIDETELDNFINENFNFKPETFIIPNDKKFIVLEREFIEDIEAFNSALSYSNSNTDYSYNPYISFNQSIYYRTSPKKFDYIIKTKMLNDDGTYNKNNSIVMFWNGQLIEYNEGIVILENRTRCYE